MYLHEKEDPAPRQFEIWTRGKRLYEDMKWQQHVSKKYKNNGQQASAASSNSVRCFTGFFTRWASPAADEGWGTFLKAVRGAFIIKIF